MRVAEECGRCDINLGILRRTWGDEVAALATMVGSLPGVISGRFESVTRSINVGGREARGGKFFFPIVKEAAATGGRGF